MAFRDMRRKRQELSAEECAAILNEHTSGVLAVSGDDGYPYAVPLSYKYYNSKIILHCAPEGHKLDGIRRNPKVSFCVIDADKVVPEAYTTQYRSVIVFGRARILQDAAEKQAALTMLAEKYSPNDTEGVAAEVQKSLNRVCMVEIAAEHITGKQAKELVSS